MIHRIRANRKANTTYDHIIQELREKVETAYSKHHFQIQMKAMKNK